MKLYYVPGACSLSEHIALIEAGLPYELVRVQGRPGQTKTTADGRDYATINPKGYVPALELDDGTILTENVALLAYIGDRSGQLLAKEGLARWRALEAVSHMSSELHPSFKPFFWNARQQEKDAAGASLDKHFGVLAAQLGDKPVLIGDRMTIADPLLVVMLMWAERFGLVLPDQLGLYLERMKQHPSVATALVEEGLVAA